jgi:NAD+ diphosphatase
MAAPRAPNHPAPNPLAPDFFAPELSAATGFGVNPLDRLSDKRGEADWVEALFGAASTRFLLFREDRPIVRILAGGALAIRHDVNEARDLGARLDETVLLGREPDGTALFAAVLAAAAPPPDADPLMEGADSALKAIDLRSLVGQGVLPAGDDGILAEGRSLTHWHATHGHCSRCGAKSVSAQAGWRRDCPSCGAQHFPRTDPVAIMLIADGDRCLLGRQPRFPPGFYSCLAGFIEPGETIETAVRRETFEEAGIRVGRVGYLASQPWPFPTSLMIGCVAEAITTEITRDETELEDCRWFDRAEVLAMLERRHPDGLTVSVPVAIAHHLIKWWVTGGTPGR